MPKQDVAVELFYDGAWHDLVSDDAVFSDMPIVIQRGNGAESAAPRPSSISLRLNNADDRFRTSNPMSPLYGKAGVNTPMRVSVGGAVRGQVEASSWSCDQSSDFRRYPRRGRAWTDVQGGGLLQRIGQWSHAVRSPMRVFDDGLSNVVGRWRMEDPAGSLVASSDVSGAQNVRLRGHSFGSQNSPPGGGTAVDAGSHPSAQFIFQPGDPQSTAGWQMSKVIYIDKLSGGGARDPLVACNVFDGQGSRVFLVDGDTGEVQLFATDPTGSPLIDQTFTTGYSWTGKWLMVHLQASYSGGTTTLKAAWRAIGDSVWLTVSATYSGVTSQPYYSVSAVLEGCSYGHFVAVRGFTDDLTSDERFDAFSGHPGERASYRFTRLCEENNIGLYVSPGFDSSQRMGAQGGTSTLAEEFEEIQATDDGIVYDLINDLKVFYLSGADRLNQAPALTLNAAGEDHGMPSLPAELNDDLPIHNVVTAKQRDGGDFTARDDTSSMGTQDPPNGRGEYKQDVDVNVYAPSVALEQQAHWWLNRGTVARPRFPKVTVNLAALDAAALAEVESVDVGSVIEITGYREYTIRLYVLGYTETIGTHSRTIVFTCFPDDVFNAGVLDSFRLQARSTVVSPALDATSTTLTLSTTDVNEQFRPGSNGVHIMLGGEEIILGTVGARTGTGPYSQVVTGCTRAVNGIQKPHGTTELVTVVDSIRLTMGDPA